MNRDEKTAVVEELASRFDETTAIFAVEYRGISVPQAAELRTKLRESDASFKVVKNRLAKLAADKSGTDGLSDLLTGPIALTLIKGDPVTAAKTITTFTKEHEILEYKGGIMDGAPLEPDAFMAISRLPGVDVLHGQMVGIIASPLTGLVAGMSNLISGLGRQLAQIAEQGLVTGEAPAEEAPQPEADAPEPEAEAEADEPAAETPEPEAPVEEPTPDEPPVEEPPSEDAPEPEAADEANAEADPPAEDVPAGDEAADANQAPAEEPADAGDDDPADEPETSDAPETDGAEEKTEEETPEED